MSVNAFHVLIDLIQNDLWWVVVLHLGTSYFTPFVLLDDLVHLVVFTRKRKDELMRPLTACFKEMHHIKKFMPITCW